jgi:hypothetical protein
MEGSGAPRYALEGFPQHDAKLQAAVRLVPECDDALGLVLGGSFAEGIADVFSDVDLKVVVDAERVPAAMEWRDARLVDGCGSAVARFSGEHVGLPGLLIVLYDDLVHVDFQVMSTEEAAVLSALPHVVLWTRGEALARALEEAPAPAGRVDAAWFEARMWTWLWYTQTKVLRGELYEAADAISYMRTNVLFPLLAAARGRRPGGARRVEGLLGELEAPFAATLPSLDRAEAMAALQHVADLYAQLADPLLEADGLAPAEAARRVVRAALADGLGWRPPAMGASPAESSSPRRSAAPDP